MFRGAGPPSPLPKQLYRLTGTCSITAQNPKTPSAQGHRILHLLRLDLQHWLTAQLGGGQA
jgi:hypothetical protein